MKTLSCLLVVVALLVGAARAQLPLPLIVKADHVVNPLPPIAPNMPRAELHGEVILRQPGGTVENVVLTVRMLEQKVEFPLGALKPDQVSSTEWSLQRVGEVAPTVDVEVSGTTGGRRFTVRIESREVTPPDPRRPGQAPPGY
jgi:hypothetical protein